MRRKIGTAFKLDEQKILPKGEVKPQLSVLHIFTVSNEIDTQGYLVVSLFEINTQYDEYLRLVLCCSNQHTECNSCLLIV